MLRNSFIHLPGVGLRTENALWQQGIVDWNGFLSSAHIKGVGVDRRLLLQQYVRASRSALLADDAVFFASCLPKSEHWRAYDFFKDASACLDIEVNEHGVVTVVTVADKFESRVLVRGYNLDAASLRGALQGVKLLVTYNGGAFDLPRLHKEFGFSFKGLHVDLRTVAARLGYVGGLKDLEAFYGIRREYEQEYRLKLKGGDPALLYRMWCGSGDEYYLDLLLKYNEADAYHLSLLAGKLIKALCSRFAFVTS